MIVTLYDMDQERRHHMAMITDLMVTDEYISVYDIQFPMKSVKFPTSRFSIESCEDLSKDEEFNRFVTGQTAHMAAMEIGVSFEEPDFEIADKDVES